jgi:sporulation protein YlmC with PRC-barrel domain
MLRTIKQIQGDKLGASDGEIGHVKDFYFDDVGWVVRYVVADTGSWMPGRLVLISPNALGRLYQGGKTLLVNLTREQIEKSPSIDAHKPVSRQHEEEYHRYYGWPYYWEDEGLWAMSPFPILTERSEPFHGEQRPDAPTSRKTEDSHLRSAQTVIGYKIQADAELVGYVEDFVLDDRSWAIRQLVVGIGSWRANRKVLIPPSEIDRISWDESKVSVKLTKEAILGLPAFDPASLGIREHDPRLFA